MPGTSRTRSALSYEVRALENEWLRVRALRQFSRNSILLTPSSRRRWGRLQRQARFHRTLAGASAHDA
jgi:hypothetical protein